MVEKRHPKSWGRNGLTGQARYKWLYMAALPFIVALFYVTSSSHFGYTPDDTYIYLRFAKNLIHGNGFSFNPGEPSYGVTSPLWLSVIALGGAIGADLYIGAKVVDLLFACFALVLCYLVTYEIVRDIAVGLCATVAFSVNAWMLRWAGTGMETSLSVVLFLAVLLFCLRNEYFISIFFAALLTLVRPEGSLVVVLILVDLAVNSFSKHRALNTAAALVLVYLALLAPWFFYAYRTFGIILPNTAFAKSGLRFDFARMSSTAVDVIQTISFTDAVAAVVMIISGTMLAMKHMKKGNRSEDGDALRFFLFRQSLLGIGWIILLPLFYFLIDVNVVSRYLLLMTPLITIYAFTFLFRIVEGSKMRRHVYTAIFLLAGLIMLQNQFVYRRYVRPGIETFEQGMQSCIIPIARWFRENTPPETRIVAPDIGAVGYFSDRRICDAAGLISREMLPLIREGRSPNNIIEEKLYEKTCKVDYVVHRGAVPEQLKADSTLLPLMFRPFYGMTLWEPRLYYYTVYKVRNSAPAWIQ